MEETRSTPARTIPNGPGLQAQRTDLSWTRSSLAFLANGALLLAHSEISQPSLLHHATTAIAFLLALFAALIAYHRRKVLSRRPLPTDLAARVQVLCLATGTMGFGVLVLTVILAR